MSKFDITPLRESSIVQVCTKCGVSASSNQDVISWVDVFMKHTTKLLICAIPNDVKKLSATVIYIQE